MSYNTSKYCIFLSPPTTKVKQPALLTDPYLAENQSFSSGGSIHGACTKCLELSLTQEKWCRCPDNKMSKSTGNSVLPGELFDGDNDFFSKAFSPNVVRFLFLQAHYRSILDLSEEALLASEKGLKKLEVGIKNISKLPTNLSLAGDWTQTDLPCTIEGSILSGKKAVELLEF